jgi:hypothetical protein
MITVLGAGRYSDTVRQPKKAIAPQTTATPRVIAPGSFISTEDNAVAAPSPPKSTSQSPSLPEPQEPSLEQREYG